MWVAGLLLSGLMMATTAVAADASGTQADATLRAADDAENVQFVLTLGLRHQDQLRQELKDMYDRSSPHYRHFLSAADFIAKYGPSKDDYAALEKFAARHGLKVVREHASHTMVNVEGSAAAIRDLFKSQMYWRQNSEGKQYLASDVEPTVPSDLASLGGVVTGLNQKPLRSFASHAQATAANAAAGNTPASTPGTGYGGSLVPNDIKTIYDLGSIQNGGQPVALVEFSSANYADAATYAAAFGLNNPVLIQKAIDGGNTVQSDAGEVMLDIEMLMAVSNPTSIYVYTSPNTFVASLDLFTQIAEDNQVGEVSTSWGLCEGDRGQAAANEENTIFTQMAAEGIAVFAASGDYGAYTCGGALGVIDPASQPYVTGVGGTVLAATNVQTYASEEVWGIPPSLDYPSGLGSGGGISVLWSIPSYQSTVTPQPVPQTGGIEFSNTMRNVPDVALFAGGPGYYIYCNVCAPDGGPGWGQWIGTSLATPLWAGFWSLVSQGLTVNEGTPTRAGFANPILYPIGENASEYAQDFHDVTVGNNNWFYATQGYDPVSGWGSYNAAALYETIVGPSNKKRISITPLLNLLLKPGT
jgi:kumamolisin